MVKSFEDLVAWIKAEVDPKEYGSATAEDAAMWFVAVKMAEMYCDTNTIKDWARLIIGGMSPLTPDECTEWILNNTYDEDGEVENSHDVNYSMWRMLESELNAFFFSPPTGAQG